MGVTVRYAKPRIERAKLVGELLDCPSGVICEIILID